MGTGSTESVALKLRGKRQFEVADWMMGKPTPEDVGPGDGTEWESLGASTAGGVLTVPASLLADFIDECEYGITALLEMADQDSDEARVDARAQTRALQTIIDKLRLI